MSLFVIRFDLMLFYDEKYISQCLYFHKSWNTRQTRDGVVYSAANRPWHNFNFYFDQAERSLSKRINQEHLKSELWLCILTRLSTFLFTSKVIELEALNFCTFWSFFDLFQKTFLQPKGISWKWGNSCN